MISQLALSTIMAVTGGASTVTATDRTPPTAPYIIYADGLKWFPGCLPLTIGIQRATDNATPQRNLTYEVFADGVRLGTLHDTGTEGAVWGTLHFTHAGPQTVTARAVDAAGNRSAAGNADIVTAYDC